MTSYLSEIEVLNLMQGLVEAGLCTDAGRDTLLAGVHPGFRASLPSKKSPLDQILSDLSTMNGVPFLSNNDVPLRQWLHNAVTWLKASSRPQTNLFQDILVQVAAESEHRLKEGLDAGQINLDLPVAVGASQEDYRTMLEEFLVPFEGILKFTRYIFDRLRDARLAHLEYHPGTLQEYFSSLAEGDPRKDLWMNYIDLLQKKNGQAVELIERFYGRIVLDEFRDACDKYLQHAEVWQLVWIELKGQRAVPAEPGATKILYASPFPDELETALANEIAKVRQLAGQ